VVGLCPERRYRYTIYDATLFGKMEISSANEQAEKGRRFGEKTGVVRALS